MKRTVFQRIVCLVLSVVFLLGSLAVTSSATKYKGDESTSSTLEEMKALIGTSSYAEYIEDYADFSGTGLSEIPINVVTDLTMGSDAVITAESILCQNSMEEHKKNWVNFGDYKNSSVYLPAVNDQDKAASASWNFTVTKEQEGLYYIQIDYYNVKTSESSVSAIQRKLKIDGKVPFDEVSTIVFDKHWIYDNVTEGEPTPVPATDTRPVGYTTVDYELVDYYKGEEAPKNGYYKYVTKIEERDGQRVYVTTSYKIGQDINGNSMTPLAAESSEWNTYTCKDDNGYYDGFFSFFMAEGTHTITLDAEREPMIIRSIKLVPATSTELNVPSYEEYINGYKNQGITSANGSSITLEAEFPDAISDTSVAPSNDNTSAVNSPVSSKAQLFNVIGETGFETIGQWAAYKFTVNETGLYKMAMRYKQNALQGMFICRTIKFSGGHFSDTPTVPFEEAYDIRFDYDSSWQSDYIGYYYTDAEGNMRKQNVEFYFEAGVEYTMYLECSLGDLRDYIMVVENALDRVNECYLKILQRTGSDPDKNQSYSFHTLMPEVLVAFLEEAVNLTKVADELEKLCGTNGSHLATLDNIARILDTMGKDNGIHIAENMSTLKTYLGTLGTWINDSKRGVMMLDSICVVPAGSDEEIPDAKAGFFKSIWFEISSFIYSFFTNYDQMGLTKVPEEGSSTVDVWLAMGRDQSQIWRTMIDADGEAGFTSKYGTAVALKLVTGGTLLPSILSGKGPDVYLGLGSADVINYAIRDAVVGVSGNDPNLSADENKVFSNFVYRDANGEHHYEPELVADAESRGWTLVSNKFDAAIKDNFAPAAMKTLRIYNVKQDGDVTYGIPMTMAFAMMFYRMDILAELGQEVPETWQQLLEILPVLQTNNMQIGVSYVSALDFMMYQMGGSMWKYTDEELYDSKYAGAKIDLDSDIAIEAFEFVCRLYSDYSFPISYDAANRFRTGEMPIVIGDYGSIYNTLVVYATDIAGLWEFSSLPGSTNKKTGEFNYDSLAGVSATVILNGCDNMLAAWQFVQWQTSADVQATYGNRIVALIGPAAKYETANIKAIENLSWTAKEKEAIRNQMDHMDAIVNYPGSYIISRYMKFAFLDTYNDGVNAHDAMMSYIDAINAEIKRKREEFDLPTVDVGEEPPMKTQN